MYSNIEIRLPIGTWTSTTDVASDELLAALPRRSTTKPVEMCVLKFKINDGEKAVVDGLVFPFTGLNKNFGVMESYPPYHFP